MLEIQQANVRGLSYEEREFLAKVKDLEGQIPKALATILSGIGNTKCPNGREFKFRMLPRNYMEGEYNEITIPGYFGQAGPATQPLYKDYPQLRYYPPIV
jgi:hypothetical protein